MASKRMDAGRGAGRPDVVRQARGQKSKRGFYLALLLVAVAGVAGILWATQRTRESNVVTLPTTPSVATNAPGYVRGSPTAPVEIVEYADFECPACGQFATVTEPDVMKRIVDAGLARYRIYDFPVTNAHRNSAAASLAAACASDQGKFWEMHDQLFAGQNDWNSFATDNPKPVFEGYATRIGLNADTWESCYDSRKYVDRIAAHAKAAEQAQLRSTPSFVIGNRMISGAQPFDVIKAMVDSARMAAASTPAAPLPAGDSAARTPVGTSR